VIKFVKDKEKHSCSLIYYLWDY